MLVIAIFVFVVGGILFGAARIILGWVLPAATLKRVDTVVSAAFAFVFKISIVALAGIILWVIWLGYSKSG